MEFMLQLRYNEIDIIEFLKVNQNTIYIYAIANHFKEPTIYTNRFR